MYNRNHLIMIGLLLYIYCTPNCRWQEISPKGLKAAVAQIITWIRSAVLQLYFCSWIDNRPCFISFYAGLSGLWRFKRIKMEGCLLFRCEKCHRLTHQDTSYTVIVWGGIFCCVSIYNLKTIDKHCLRVSLIQNGRFILLKMLTKYEYFNY